jgi:phytoene dehydrogenase-like protein
MADVYNRIVIGDREYEYPSGEAAFRERMATYFPDESAAIDRYLDLVRQANRSARAYFAHRAFLAMSPIRPTPTCASLSGPSPTARFQRYSTN